MASIKLKFRPSSVPGKEGSLFFQIIHERKVKTLVTSYQIFPSEWSDKRSAVVPSNDDKRREYIQALRVRIRWDEERLTKILRKYEQQCIDYSVEDIIEEFNRYKSEYTLFNYMQQQIARLRQNGNTRTAETYASALNSFKKFNADEDIMLDNITPSLMETYETWLQKRGLVPNSISFYTRILRAVYNRAVDEEIIEQRYPFRHVYTGVDKTVKRALPLSIIKKIKNLDFAPNSSVNFARDMFLLSFYLRGMSFVDMCFLRKTDLKKGYISYRRRKTGQLLSIAWTKEMQQLLSKYPENESEYLLPIIKHKNINEYRAYRNQGYSINENLKKIGEILNLDVSLTMYVARHSWATAAKAKGVPLSIISEGMGHDNETTTQIYLASLDSSIVDKANDIILKSL